MLLFSSHLSSFDLVLEILRRFFSSLVVITLNFVLNTHNKGESNALRLNLNVSMIYDAVRLNCILEHNTCRHSAYTQILDSPFRL